MVERLLSIPALIIFVAVFSVSVMFAGLMVCFSLVVDYEKSMAFMVPVISKASKLLWPAFVGICVSLLSADIDAASEKAEQLKKDMENLRVN